MSRALLFVPDDSFDDRSVNALLPLVDRPFLQHIVERLSSEGVDSIDIVTVRQEEVRSLLGDGSRWGFQQVDYYLKASDVAVRADGETFLVVFGDQLPIVPVKPYLDAGVPFLITDAASGLWSGWALVEAAQASNLPLGFDDAQWDNFFADSAYETVPANTILSVQTLEELLWAQKALLDQAHPGLLRTGREIEPGIHLSRNVVLHHTATVRPPIFIGQDCRIGAGCEIGPYAVIGDGCIVDEGATISESLVLSGSYIGEDVEIRESVVDRNRLMSVRFGASVELTDLFLLGDLSDNGGAGLLAPIRKFFGRAASKLQRGR